MLPPDVVIANETAGDAAAIEALHAAAFGPGRFARTAYRLREGVPPRRELAFVAKRAGELVGAVTMTRIAIGADPALLLGPLAVAPGLAGQGIGRTLMRTAMDAAKAAGEALVLLVGDPPYYAPFGFATVQPYGRVTLPGPVDPARLMLAGLRPGAWEAAGGMARRLVG